MCHTTLASETTAQTGVQQNDDMRKITAWVAIVAVRTAVTGYFGQNVPYPGSQAASGIIGSTVLIVTFALILFILFKRNGWL
jgi:magnesium transporter